jgi:hypothetical protein
VYSWRSGDAATTIAGEGDDGMPNADHEVGPPIQAEGRLQAQGLTLYQYGSHVLVGPQGETQFALRGADLAPLDRLIGRHVRVYGQLVPGYPVDMGPPLIEVREVAEA